LKKYIKINLTFILIIFQFLLVFYIPVNAQVNKSFYPVADSYVRDHYQENNYGNLDYLMIANYTDKIAFSFIMFDLSDLPNDAYINLGTLKLKSKYIGRGLIKYDLLSPNSIGVCKSENITWIETDINWNNKPEFSQETISIDGVYSPDTWGTWEITEVIIPGEKLTIVLKAYHEETGFYSRESDYCPELEIEYLERGFIIIVQIIVAVSAISVIILVSFIYMRRRRSKKK